MHMLQILSSIQIKCEIISKTLRKCRNRPLLIVVLLLLIGEPPESFESRVICERLKQLGTWWDVAEGREINPPPTPNKVLHLKEKIWSKWDA